MIDGKTIDFEQLKEFYRKENKRMKEYLAPKVLEVLED